MRFGPILILLFVYLYQCKGAPPKEVAKKSRTRGHNFTSQEDNLIIKELARLDADHQHIYSNSVWENIRDKQNEKCRQHISGFPQERSLSSLRGRLQHMAKINHPELTRKLPEKILLAIRQDLNVSARAHRPVYTPEEEQFIIDELSNPSCKNTYATSTLEEISKKHGEKLKAKTPGFNSERTAASFNRHIQRMRKNGDLPDEVVKKMETNQRGGSSSEATPSSVEVNLEAMDEDEEDNEDESD